MLSKARREVVAILIEPSSVLEKVKKDQALQQKLRLRIGLGGRELLIFLKIDFYRIQRIVKAPEKVLCKRFFVKSLGPISYPTICIGCIRRPNKCWEIEFHDSASGRVGRPAEGC